MDEQTQFYDKYSQQITRTVRKMLHYERNQADVEDIVADAWIRIFKNWDSFSGKSQRITWAHTIVKRATVDFVRKKVAYREAVQHYFETFPILSEGSLYRLLGHRTEYDADELDYSYTVPEILNKAGLTEKQAEAITLSLLGFSHADGGARCDISRSSFNSRLKLAREKLVRFFDSQKALKAEVSDAD